MRIHGIYFGPIFDASGAEGFFGEGYAHHKFFRLLGLTFDGCAFVAKTTTLNARAGNMPMKKDGITPKERKPKCIKIYFRKAMMLNAVALSGPGAKALFEINRWQKRTMPFFLSFMSVENTAEARTAELEKFVDLFANYLPDFLAPVGLQINYSCPNVGLNPNELIDEVKTGISIASALDIPLMPKFNVLAPVKAVKEISEKLYCDAICISNTIPWGKLPERINWKKLFGFDISPLAKFGGGGLSGRPLFPLVVEWITEARKIGIKKPINAGGGILCANDVDTLHNAGASSIFIGSVVNLRPWRVKKIIDQAYEVF